MYIFFFYMYSSILFMWDKSGSKIPKQSLETILQTTIFFEKVRIMVAQTDSLLAENI